MDKSTIKGLKNIGIELLNGYGLTEASPIVQLKMIDIKNLVRLLLPYQM